ncbi:uncharacterized protein HaLaN_18845 [Haematococcus lacustris]|uniref:Uncharacterized protein n=1 Tax=Haematococcus lacustris TaxID=44745 RepID=A0A699ZZD2_HAELA|nr:uncharacterized protein HaLaN_18845 [Haematococcus lacustris]
MESELEFNWSAVLSCSAIHHMGDDVGKTRVDHVRAVCPNDVTMVMDPSAAVAGALAPAHAVPMHAEEVFFGGALCRLALWRCLLEGFEFERTVETDGGLAEPREFVFNPATQIGVGIDPGVTQAVSAASGVWDPATGQLLADQLRRWKLTKGQVKHGSGLNNVRCDTERWLAPIKPHLQHLAAASSAGTSLEANLKHITVTLATWDAVWEVYLDPKWAQQRLRLYGAQDRTMEQFFKKLEQDMAEVSMKRHWGEQVAPTGAVLLARAGEAASQGQRVPWPGLQTGARQATQDPACCGTVVCAPPS